MSFIIDPYLKPAITGTITVSESSLSFSDTDKNTISYAKTFDVSGIDLVTGITITAPSGFIINTDGSNTNMSPLVLPQIGGKVLPPVTIYVKFNPLLVQSYSGNINCSSAGCLTQSVSVSGNGIVGAYSFQSQGSQAFPAMDGIGLLSYEGNLRLLGGWSNSLSPVTTNTDWQSSNGLSWTQNSNASWTRRHSMGHGVKDGKMWIWGGDYHTGSYQKDVWSYDSINGWAEATSDWGVGVGDRMLFSYVVHKNYLYIIGGQNADFVTPTMYNDVWRSSDGITWSKVGDLPTSFFAAGVCWSDGVNLFIGGGGRYLNAGADNLNDKVYKSSDDGANWTLVSTVPTEMTGTYQAGIAWDNKLWWLNGFRSGANQTGLYYSEDNGVTWIKFFNNPTARHATGICVHNDKLYIVAGNLHDDSYYIEKLAVTISNSWQSWRNSLTQCKPSYELTNSLNTLMLTLSAQSGIKYCSITMGLETDEQRLKPLITPSGDGLVKIGNVELNNNGIRPTDLTSAVNLKFNFIDDMPLVGSDDLFYAVCETDFNAESQGCAAGAIDNSEHGCAIWVRYPSNTCYYQLNGLNQATQTGITEARGYKVVFKDNLTETKFRDVDGTIYSETRALFTPSNDDFYLGACHYHGGILASCTEVPQGLFIAGQNSLVDHDSIQAAINSFASVRGIVLS